VSQRGFVLGSIRKRNGKYQAQVRRHDAQPVSRTFITKKDALVWIRGIESRIDAGDVHITSPKMVTLGDLLKRYAEEITPEKKGKSQEIRRINRLLRDPLAATQLSVLSSTILAEFRDRRIHDGLRATQIDLVLIRHCVKIARQEWGITMPGNPVDAIRIPNGVRQRDRRLNEGEYEKLKQAAQTCRNIYTWASIDFAIETAMRRSEILNMHWEDVCFEKKIVILNRTKNGSSREVPLSRHAQSLLVELSRSDTKVFPISEYALRQSWERLVKRAEIENLRFHDLRREATSRFFEKGLNVPEVALITGHKDPRMLFRYTKLKAAELVSKLDYIK